jgi:Ca2+-binding EF-hand superfamily protein
MLKHNLHNLRFVIAALLLTGAAFAGDGAAPVTAVLFAPAHPVFLRLRVQVDGQSVGRFRERAVGQWFGQFDHNHDGFLDKKEIAPFLSALAEQAGAAARPTWQAADVDPADGKVSPREFRAFVDAQLGPPLALAVHAETASEVDASLFRHLDANGDGILTLDELHNAKAALAPLDADDDETISTAELMAAAPKRASPSSPNSPSPSAGAVAKAASPSPKSAPSAQAQKTRRPAERLPLLLLGPDTPAESIAEALLNEYGSATRQAGDRRLSAKALGLSADEVRRYDGSPADTLGVRELAQLLLERPPQLELSIQLFDQQRGRARVSVARGNRPPPFEWQQSSADSGMLVVNGLKVALAAKRTRGATGDMSSFYALRFNIVDRDKNNYLDRQEFAELGLPGADFAAVDANGDKQITPDELAAFLKQPANVYLNQVTLAVTDESQSLFDFLDTRPDGRLSPRELNAAAARLRALDRNQDGNLTLGELRTQIRVEAEVKRPPEARPAMLLGAPRNQSSTAAIPRDRGPEWFRRMDRNYDGDVSWREFLGPRAAFDQLDTDHDGLLSPEEADHAR